MIVNGIYIPMNTTTTDYGALTRWKASERSAKASIQGVYDILWQINEDLPEEERKDLVKAAYSLPNPLAAFELLLQQTKNSYELVIAIKEAINSPKYAPRNEKGGFFSADPLTVECINHNPVYHKMDDYSLLSDNKIQYVDKAVTCYGRQQSTKNSTMRRLLVTPRAVLDEILKAILPFGAFWYYLFHLLKDNGMEYKYYLNNDLNIRSIPARFEMLKF